MKNTTKIPARLESAAQDGIVAGASAIWDDNIGTYQSIINHEVRRDITNLSQAVSTLSGVPVIEYSQSDVEVSMSPDTIGVWSNAMPSLHVTLIAPEVDNKAAIYTILVNVGSGASISIEASGEKHVMQPSDYYIEQGCMNEIQVLYAGGTFYIRSVNYK